MTDLQKQALRGLELWRRMDSDCKLVTVRYLANIAKRKINKGATAFNTKNLR